MMDKVDDMSWIIKFSVAVYFVLGIARLAAMRRDFLISEARFSRERDSGVQSMSSLYNSILNSVQFARE